jgi:two-component system phosphate regulon sensor histidine kinase PhoR
MASGPLQGWVRVAAGLAVAVALAALYAVAAPLLEASHRAWQAAELAAQARRLAAEASVAWSAGGLPRADAPCPTAAGLAVTLVLPGDLPACAAPVPLATHPDSDSALRADRAAALGGRVVQRQLLAPERGLAIALPVRSEGRVVAALQAVWSPLPPHPALGWLRAAFWLAGGLLLAVLLGLERLAGAGLRRRAEALAGRLRHLAGAMPTTAPAALPAVLPAAVPPAATIAPDGRLDALAAALSAAEAAVDERLRQLARQLDERESVLASMVEGVLAVAPDGRLLNLNAAAARMFGIAPGPARGRDLLESVRHPGLQRFLRDAQAGPAPLERELTLYGPEPRTLQAHGTVLRDGQGRSLGTLVVLNDVTHLRHLERMRQDFVANVSHEIKTPITSIKGFVETLLDGALDDPPTARRFLEIVVRHADRLNAITDDLLNLSRIEQEAEGGVLHTEPVALAALLQAAAQVCQAKAEARGIRIVQAAPPGLEAWLNPQLMEQAVVNLLDNAVKYAPEGSEVRLEAAPEPAGTVIRVRDQGPGIPPEHLPRLFERFYRADKARSRRQGGTGLGLAIVKHIAQAHRGRVEVESRPGAGSTFSLHLPHPPPER